MSSTDDAFIKAFEDAHQRTIAMEAAKRRSYIVGSSTRRMTEFVAGVTSPVKLDTQDPPTGNRADEPSTARTASTAPPSEQGSRLIELRLDATGDPVVPPPHTPVVAFAKAAQRRSKGRAGQLNLPHPIRPLPSPSETDRPSNTVRIDHAHHADHTGRATAGGSRRPKVKKLAPPTAEPTPPAVEPFTAAWEVDAFRWPAVCRQLDSLQSQPLLHFVRGILAETWRGARIVAVTQFERGEGSTTLSLCLAQWAARLTGQVALVDGDVLQPRVAESLGLSFGRGWEETSPQVPLADVAVHSIADRLVVLPLGDKGGILAAESDRELGREVLARLARSFELVVLDAGPMYDAAHHWFTAPTAQQIDRVLVVQDVRRTAAQQVMDVRRRLSAQGIDNVSVVENFQESQRLTQ